MNLPIHKYGKTERRKFGKINEVIDIPDLVEIQKSSYNAFINEGIAEVFEDFSPICDFSDHYELYFLNHWFDNTPKYSEKECRNRDATYALPLHVTVRLVNKTKGEVIDHDRFGFFHHQRCGARNRLPARPFPRRLQRIDARQDGQGNVRNDRYSQQGSLVRA